MISHDLTPNSRSVFHAGVLLNIHSFPQSLEMKNPTFNGCLLHGCVRNVFYQYNVKGLLQLQSLVDYKNFTWVIYSNSRCSICEVMKIRTLETQVVSRNDLIPGEVRHRVIIGDIKHHEGFLAIGVLKMEREREREMFYLTKHSTQFIYGYMVSDIWLRTILIVKKETRSCHIGYSYRLTARVLLYAPSHRQDNTYHGLCYTSRGALAGMRNSS